jgi:hypothetical protein
MIYDPSPSFARVEGAPEFTVSVSLVLQAFFPDDPAHHSCNGLFIGTCQSLEEAIINARYREVKLIPPVGSEPIDGWSGWELEVGD